MVEADLKLV